MLHRYRTRSQRTLSVRRLAFLETLEARWCPASTFQLIDGRLSILGDETANTIEVVDRGNGTLDVVADGSVETFEQVNELIIDALAGDDQIEIALDPSDASPATMVAIQVRGGADDDVITVNGPVESDDRSILDAELLYQFDLGTGNDQLAVAVRRFDAVDLDVHAEDGSDQITIGLLLPAADKLRAASANIVVNVEGGENAVQVATLNFDQVDAQVIGADVASNDEASLANEVSLNFIESEAADGGEDSFANQLSVTVEFGNTEDTLSLSSQGYEEVASSIALGDGPNVAQVLHRTSGDGLSTAAVDATFGDDHDVLSLTLFGFDEVAADVATADGDDTVNALFRQSGRAASGAANLTLDAGAGDDQLIVHSIAYLDLSAVIVTGAGDDKFVGNFLESIRRRRGPNDDASLQLIVDLGAGDDRSMLLSRGFAAVETTIDTGPAGDGIDKLSSTHLAGSGGFFKAPRLRRSVTTLDGDNDRSRVVTRAYDTVDIDTDETQQAVVISA